MILLRHCGNMQSESLDDFKDEYHIDKGENNCAISSTDGARTEKLE